MAFSLSWWLLILIFFRIKVPISRSEVETGDVTSGLVELLKRALFVDLSFVIEGDDMVAVRKAFSYRRFERLVDCMLKRR
jgi:hypothetical protein